MELYCLYQKIVLIACYQFVRLFQDESERTLQSEYVKENPLCIAMM